LDFVSVSCASTPSVLRFVSRANYEDIVRGGDIRANELVRRDRNWCVRLVVKRTVAVRDECDDIVYGAAP